MKRSKVPCERIFSTSRKKNKTHSEVSSLDTHSNNAESSTLTPPTGGRGYTLSVALPGSIICNAQTTELKTYLAGQVARAMVVFNVDEVVVFDEGGGRVGRGSRKERNSRYGDNGNHSNPNVFLGRILNYLETPQYLRKALFPMHSDFRYVGLLSPLDCPHHMRQCDHSSYREGVVLDTPCASKTSLINCGLTQNVEIDEVLEPGNRVTVAIDDITGTPALRTLRGHVVSPSTPRTMRGLYWGYTVRMASSFGTVFTESPYEGSYDLTVGTSERGDSVDDLEKLPSFKHVLVVLGGVQGLEHSLRSDHTLHVEDVSLLFDYYLNVCPDQGSRTIRTEEALLVILSSLRPLLTSANSTPDLNTMTS